MQDRVAAFHEEVQVRMDRWIAERGALGKMTVVVVRARAEQGVVSLRAYGPQERCHRCVSSEVLAVIGQGGSLNDLITKNFVPQDFIDRARDFLSAAQPPVVTRSP